MSERPILAITLGDPAGVGPEVTARALARTEVWECCRPLVVGDARILADAVDLVGAVLAVHPVRAVSEARFEPDAPDVLDLHNVDPALLRRGQVSAAAGRAAAGYIERAVELAQARQVAAIVTCPINKAAFKAAGIHHIGHTEMLATLTGDARVTTMLATTGLRVVHVTRHVPLSEVARHITRAAVLETIRLTHIGMQSLGFTRPRIAVAALNPHGGDGGLVGREELEQIAPAVEAAQGEGIAASGPIPADSVFFRAIRGEYDVVVAMFHDQGHIPIKTHGFERSVTVTLGLSLVRTSVDHGTAFDIAWQGRASEESLVEAVLLAAQMVS